MTIHPKLHKYFGITILLCSALSASLCAQVDYDPSMVAQFDEARLGFRAGMKGDFEAARRHMLLSLNHDSTYLEARLGRHVLNELAAAKVDEKTVKLLFEAVHENSISLPDKALKKNNKAIKHNKAYGPSYFHRAVLRSSMGQRDDALEDLAAAIQNAPDFVMPYQMRASLLMREDKLELARADLNRAREIAPNNTSIIARLIMLESRENNYDAAITLYEEWAESFNNQPRSIGMYPTYINRGITRLNEKQYEAALDDFDTAASLSKNPTARAATYRGAALRHLKRYEEAITEFNSALALDGDSVLILRHRGQAYMHSGLHDEAIADFTNAIAMKPDAHLLYYCRGEVYIEQKQFENAILDLHKALHFNSRYYWAYYLIAFSHDQLHQKTDAIAAYERFIAQAPDAYSRHKSKAQERIAKLKR